MLGRALMIGLGVAAVAGCEVSVTKDADDIAACFVLCADDEASCESHPGLDHNDCGAIAEAECGGEPQEQKLITGCECPFDGEPSECTAADGVPDWI